MARQFLGALCLLAVVAVFVTPALIVTGPASADYNHVYSQPYVKYWYCPDGTLLSTASGVTTHEVEIDHPPDTETIVEEIVRERGENPAEVIVIVIRRRVYVHTDHSVTYHYNSALVTYNYTVSDSVCR